MTNKNKYLEILPVAETYDPLAKKLDHAFRLRGAFPNYLEPCDLSKFSYLVTLQCLHSSRRVLKLRLMTCD